MLLKPQNSRKQLLEREIETLSASRSALAAEVNDLTAARTRESAGFERETLGRASAFDAFEHDCSVRKSALLSELSALEARRTELMRPLTDKIEAVAERERLAGIAELANATRTLELDALEAELVGKNAEIANSKAVLVEKSSKVDEKLEKIARQEKFQRESASALSSKWEELRKWEAERSAALDERERSLELREASVEKQRTFNANEKNRIDADRRDVDSRRSALRAAIEEHKKLTA